MEGEKDLSKLLRSMQPQLHEGEYVFCTVADTGQLPMEDIVGFFREQEGITVVIERSLADRLGFEYGFVVSWITLNVHSALEAVGLTAAFSTALGRENISCNVIAAYHHDHIFVNKEHGETAMRVLQQLSKQDPQQE